MSDTATGEAPAEAAPPEAAAAPAPEAEPAPPAEPEVESEDNRTAREKVLDHFADCDDPDQSVAQIIQGTGLSRNTGEQPIFRAVQSEQLQRLSQGVYRLAPPKPPSPPKPEPPSRNGHTNDEWVARIEAWQVNPASWNVEEDGPPPNDPNHRIPLDVVGRFKDRQAREAKEREKREAAAAKQESADAALRDQLIAATGGNFTSGPGLDDLAPIKMALELVPLGYILSAIRHKTDRKCYPKNEPATSWGEVRFLKGIAEDDCQYLIVPSLIDACGKAAAKAPKKPVERAEAAPATQGPPALVRGGSGISVGA